MPDENELWAAFQSDASAEEQQSAPVETTAVDTQLPAADAHTEGTSDTDAAEIVEEVEPEAPAPDEAVSDDAEAKSEEEDDAESFDDLLDPIPTPEQLLEKHKAHRPSQAIKDDLTMLSTEWRKDRDLVTRIGGELGVEMLSPVVGLLGNPDPSPHDAVTAFDAMLRTNPTATLLGLMETTNIMLDSDQQWAKTTSDALLQRVFGDGATKQHIQNLLLLEQAGIVNMEEDMKYVNENTDATSVFAKQTDTIKRLEQELAEQKELLNDPEKLAKVQTSKADSAFESDFDNRISEAVAPFLEKGKWGKDSALVEFVMPGIMYSLKNDPDYKQMQAYIRQNGYQADKLPYPVASKMLALSNKAKARIGIAVQKINADLRGKAANGLNAQVKEKVGTTKPQPAQIQKTNGDSYAQVRTPASQKEEDLWKKYAAAEASA